MEDKKNPLSIGDASANWHKGHEISSLVAKLIKEIGKLLDKLVDDGLI